jgi:hypothetical protein
VGVLIRARKIRTMGVANFLGQGLTLLVRYSPVMFLLLLHLDLLQQIQDLHMIKPGIVIPSVQYFLGHGLN